MAKYTGTLSAAGSNVKLCTINKPRSYAEWFASVMITGTFGTGTVGLGLSIDSGVTVVPLMQDGTASPATSTAAAVLNVKAGTSENNTGNPDLYAYIGAATNPSVTITVFDNRG